MDHVVTILLGELEHDGGGNNSHQESPSAHIFVIGATNHFDVLDPSLLCPGRLS